MTDSELLETAAKAAEIGGGWDWPRGAKAPTFWRDAKGKAWQPLTDDGDALRLAVKLRICIEHASKAHGGDYGVNAWPRGNGHMGATETEISDYEAATRRAIVRAAAEIGKGME